MNAFLYNIADPKTPIEISELFLVGRDSMCNLNLQDEQLSERHARIEFKGYNYLIRDLRSENGTYVNGAPVSECYLHEGDEVRFGQQTFFFSFERQYSTEGIGITSKNTEWNLELTSLGNVAKTDFPVLLIGQSGSGKEIIASALHANSKRSKQNCVTVNCSALTETLVESELFGHMKGSFTGASTDRKGAFETADHGTIFLDEIGDLPFSMQAKLLRAIENQEIRPVGSDKTLKINVRIIAATHQDLKAKIKLGSFRADLFYRLSVITVNPPPLKDRMEDFDDLANYFCRRNKVRISVTAMDELKRHSWPGNIRELRNFILRAAAYFPNTYIDLPQLKKLIEIIPLTNIDVVLESYPNKTLPAMKELEKDLIIKRLSFNMGNQRKTSQDLGIPKSTLHDRIRNYGIDLGQFQKQATSI